MSLGASALVASDKKYENASYGIDPFLISPQHRSKGDTALPAVKLIRRRKRTTRSDSNDESLDRFHSKFSDAAVQRKRISRLFSAVVLAALDDAVKEQNATGKGMDRLLRWARSKDGHEVLHCAGISPNDRVIRGMLEFVDGGIRTSKRVTRNKTRLATGNQKPLLDGGG